jgi:hypothetical protein
MPLADGVDQRRHSGERRDIMKHAIATMAACATLLSAGAAFATLTPTPQQNCDYARLTAWRVYQSCVDAVVAKDAKGRFAPPPTTAYFAAFAKCRHAYFKKWVGFQTTTSLAGTTCIGNRFDDNGNGTVTDNLTGLVWETKQNYDYHPNLADPHDADNLYTWSTGSDSADGTLFTDFLSTLNSGVGFAGANGWRLPTFAELQTTLRDFPCTGVGYWTTCYCGLVPCSDAIFGPAQYSYYWTATEYVPNRNYVWTPSYGHGYIFSNVPKQSIVAVRAVRGGF